MAKNDIVSEARDHWNALCKAADENRPPLGIDVGQEDLNCLYARLKNEDFIVINAGRDAASASRMKHDPTIINGQVYERGAIVPDAVLDALPEEVFTKLVFDLRIMPLSIHVRRTEGVRLQSLREQIRPLSVKVDQAEQAKNRAAAEVIALETALKQAQDRVNQAGFDCKNAAEDLIAELEKNGF